MLNARASATRIVHAVVSDGRSLSDALPAGLAEVGQRDQGLVQELSFGVIRWYQHLDAIAAELLTKPLRSRDRIVNTLILTGLYQLGHTRIPAHAACAETVQAARQLDFAWSCKLINAVLRNFQRNRKSLEDAISDSPEARWCHPLWLQNQIRDAWPEAADEVLDANNRQAPMTLRVNLRKIERQAYLARLTDAAIPARAHPLAQSAVVLEQAVNVHDLPGFTEALVSVQDAAGQLVAPLLELTPESRVLDACAAPGSKTCHLLELAPTPCALTALDISASRLRRLSDNLRRLDLAANIIEGDALHPEVWWDGQRFDRILLDAPCTATGVIRRHPDIKLNRKETDLEALVETQQNMLSAVWPLLSQGGMLLYTTCSVLPDENENQIRRFLQQQSDASEVALDKTWGRPRPCGLQLLPGDDDMDGFFFAALKKN